MRVWLVLLAGLLSMSLFAAEPAKHEMVLRDGDLVALCGDSITSNGAYPGMIELYQLLCCPSPKVTLKNFGRWGEVAAQFPAQMDKDVLPHKCTVALICYGMNNCRSAKVMADTAADAWAGTIKAVADKFKASGVRTIVLASPGCVDSTHFTLAQSLPPDPAATDATNKNLCKLRYAAEKLAAKEGYVFADMHKPMIEVMAKAKEKHGTNFAFAGGKTDGVHPGQAGHLVMAWAYLKALGYDGEVGTITVDIAKGQAHATAGHTVLACKDGSVDLESTRWPFCFPADEKNPSNSSRSVAELFSFNEDLNRFKLVVLGAKSARLKVTWGAHSKEFEAAALAKGVNLAAEFFDHPFLAPFNACAFALSERNQCAQWLKQDRYKDDPGMHQRYERALKGLEPKTINHTIRVEAVP